MKSQIHLLNPKSLFLMNLSKKNEKGNSKNRIEEEEHTDEEPAEEYIEKRPNKKKGDSSNGTEEDQKGMGRSKKAKRQHTDESDTIDD